MDLDDISGGNANAFKLVRKNYYLLCGNHWDTLMAHEDVFPSGELDDFAF